MQSVSFKKIICDTQAQDQVQAFLQRGGQIEVLKSYGSARKPKMISAPRIVVSTLKG